MRTKNPDLLKEVKVQNEYCGVSKWNTSGITGKGVVVWNMENGQADHGQMTQERIGDAAPCATVITAGWQSSFNGNTIHYNKVVLDNGTEYKVEDFIKQFNVKVLTRSVGDGLQKDNGTAMSEFWKGLIKKYNLVVLNAAGNEGSTNKDRSDEIAILVGACGLYKGKTPRRDRDSSTGKGIDFCDFRGWMSGTSFSTPYLAGKACLLIERYGHHLTQENIYQYFKDHCEDMEVCEEDNLTGWGIPIMGDPEEKWKTLSPEEKEIRITIGEKTMLVNGETVILDQPAIVDQTTNRALIPVRAIAEALGATVSWDQDSKTITIGGNKNEKW